MVNVHGIGGAWTVVVARISSRLDRRRARIEAEAFAAGYRCGHRAGLREGREESEHGGIPSVALGEVAGERKTA